MRCVNCQNEVNVGVLVCPYCHTTPFVFGSQPYEVKNIGEPSPHDPEMTLGILVTIFPARLAASGHHAFGIGGCVARDEVVEE